MLTAITQIAKEWQIDLAIIGPEAPLEKGLADALWNIAYPDHWTKKTISAN